MTLARQFVGAKIIEKENYVILEIEYCWYYVMNFTERFVCDNIEQAKTKLLRERSQEKVFVIGIDGKEKNQSLI